jgi:hypothetical protein
MVAVTALEEAIAEEVKVQLHRLQYRDSPKDRAVARHELSHCLANFVCNSAPMHAVSIDDFGNGEMLNKTLPRPDATPDDESEADTMARLRRKYPAELTAALSKHITVFLAGRAADEFGESGLPASSSRSDLEEADRLAVLTVGKEGRDSLLGTCRATAAEIVRSGWPIIQELGALLVDFRELPGRVVETLMEERPLACSLREAYPPRATSTTYVRMPPDDADWWTD